MSAPLSPPLSVHISTQSPSAKHDQDWHGFYKKDEKYKTRGVLAGRFYDARGKPTKELADFERCARQGREEKEREAAEKKLLS